MKNILLRVLNILVIATTFISAPASAISDADKSIISTRSEWYNHNLCNTSDPNAVTLSLRDQIAQQLFVQVDSDSEAKTDVGTYHVGGILPSSAWLKGGIDASMKQAVADKGTFTVPAYIGIDEEGGLVDRLNLDPNNQNSAKDLGKTSTNNITKVATAWATQMKAYGVDVDFAPVADMSEPNNKVIGDLGRAFSGDPATVAKDAAAFAAGLESQNIIPTFKHFPGHGGAGLGDSHTGAITTAPLNQLKALDLKPYETLLSDSKAWVMVGHLNVPGLDPSTPASLSKAAYDLLHNNYNFNGISITDDLGGMKAINNKYDTPTAVEMALSAGATMALFTDTTSGKTVVKDVIDKIEKDAKTDSALNDRIAANSAKILAAKGVTTGGTGTNTTTTVNGSTKLIGKDNPEKVYNFLLQKNLTKMQIAAMMGNLEDESGFNPRAIQSNGVGHGIVQWSKGDRWDTNSKGNVKDFATGKFVPTEHGDIWDLAIQLDFMWYELNGTYKSVFDDFKAIPSSEANLEKATLLIADKYEVGAHDRRVTLAQKWFKSGINTGGGGGGDTTGSACTSGTSGGTGTSGDFTFPQITTQAKIVNQKPSRWCYTSQTSCHHDYRAADIMADEGTANVVAVSGTVIKAIDMNSCPGKTKYDVPRVQIKGDDGNYYYYTHMKPGSIKVHDNQKVSAGDPLGQVGPSQCAEGTQPHLHFQMSSVPINNTNDVSEQAKYIDPQPNLVAAFKNLPEK